MTPELADLILDLLAYADDATDVVWQYVPTARTEEAMALSVRLEKLAVAFEGHGVVRPTVYAD